jgi:putative acetyltransferase
MIVLLFLSRRISTVTLRLDCDLSVDQHTISTQQPSKLSVQLRLGRWNGRMPTMDTESPIVVKDESPCDREQVREVNEAAFGRSDEADLIDRLRVDGTVLLSLVAEFDGQIVGHILFSRMTVETGHSSVAAVSLAPMAVLPDHQGRKVGDQLVRIGLSRLRDRGERIVLVLGHEQYYPRFGFSSELARCLVSPFPPEAFMALELSEGALAGVRGAVQYSPAFGL